MAKAPPELIGQYARAALPALISRFGHANILASQAGYRSTAINDLRFVAFEIAEAMADEEVRRREQYVAEQIAVEQAAR